MSMGGFPRDEIRTLTRIHQVIEKLFGCRHEWGFPISSEDMREYYQMVGKDSHQTCTICGRQRFFDFETLKPGPMFMRRVKI
jgi:hypothetical protein